MPQVLEQNRNFDFASGAAENYTSVIYDGVYYPEEREDDMGETSVHIKLIADFLQMLRLFFKDQRDVFLSANMNLYYEEGNPRRWFAPDLLIAFGVPKVERSSYLLWREKVFPQVILEVASERTWRADVTEKLELYEKLGAEEYYILDPEFAYLPEPLTAYKRQDGIFVKREVTNGVVFSPRLNLEIMQTENAFRLFNPKTNEFLLTLEESEEKRKQTEAELEKLKAEIERLKAEK